MSARTRGGRGQPVIALGLLVVGWIGVRAALWQSPFPLPVPGLPALHLPRLAPTLPSASQRGDPSVAPARRSRPPVVPVWRTDPLPVAASPVPGDVPIPVMGTPPREAPRLTFASGDVAAAHQLLYLAGMAMLPIPRDVAQVAGLVSVAPANAPAPPAQERPAPAISRWHGDGWIAWRGGSGLAPVAFAPGAIYGGTQAGAVLRYNLTQAGRSAPQAYLRATFAPERAARQGELAAGVSARLFATVPVRVMAELRATHAGGRTALRPAAMAVTELAPHALPAGFTIEAYGQAGYVGGRSATLFADGLARIDRPFARVGSGALRLGGGAWGGAQKGAARLDIGPSATLDLRASDPPLRLSADYRWRIAGQARPQNGLALTISTGF